MDVSINYYNTIRQCNLSNWDVAGTDILKNWETRNTGEASYSTCLCFYIYRTCFSTRTVKGLKVGPTLTQICVCFNSQILGWVELFQNVWISELSLRYPRGIRWCFCHHPCCWSFSCTHKPRQTPTLFCLIRFSGGSVTTLVNQLLCGFGLNRFLLSLD